MAVRCVAAFLLLNVILPKSADADLITHFNFNDYDGNSAMISADSGTGVIVLDEEGTTWPANELDVATGTTVNAVAPDPAGDALSLDNNGDATLTRTLTFQIDTTGYRDILFSTALAGSNSTYDTGQISYSLDGTSFTYTAISVDPSTTGSFALHTADLSGFTVLNNQPSLFIRLSLSGNNLVPNQHLLVDNVQFTATTAAVPEARAWVMSLVSLAFMAAICWRGRRVPGIA